ncbi:MAG: polysaccharide biosynthesis/export family protein [Rhizobiaceae bacterium]|nr:polysaccharide biosynthesis/export family protein [Rhizobiaceae bacterium]
MGFGSGFIKSIRLGRRVSISATLALAMAMGTTGANAADLAPQTRIRLKVIQWIPVRSEYEEWAALGGEFTISHSGNISLPVVGEISIGDMDTQAFADEVAARLQKSTGLVNKPEVSVEIIEYPPVYVAGDVARPGDYRFREGMTVLQAIAIAGGERRSLEGGGGTIRMISELRNTNDEIVRTSARIARLQAELDGASEINFPNMPEADRLAADEVFARERMLFEARNEELARQSKSLNELHDLFEQEISVLEQKRVASEQGVVSAEKELEGVAKLVDKGFAVASRKSEMERIVSGFKSDALDQTTAIMRARQGAAEAMRNLDALKDRRRSEVAREIQDTRTLLDQARLRRDVTQRLLVDSISSPSEEGASGPAMTLTVVRVVDGKASQIEADETTLLQPGDVVNLRLKLPPGTALLPEDDTRRTGTSASQ